MKSEYRSELILLLDARFWQDRLFEAHWLCTLEAANIVIEDLARFISAVLADLTQGENKAVPDLLAQRKREYSEQRMD